MTAISSEHRTEIEKLERKHAEHPGGRYFVPLANAFRKAGALSEAVTVLRRGLESHPEYVSAHIVLGRCLADQGDLAGARGAFEYVLTLDTQNLVALRTLGDLAANAGDAEDARRWYEQLLEVDPMNEEARRGLEAIQTADPQMNGAEEGGAAELPADRVPADDPVGSGSEHPADGVLEVADPADGADPAGVDVASEAPDEAGAVDEPTDEPEADRDAPAAGMPDRPEPVVAAEVPTAAALSDAIAQAAEPVPSPYADDDSSRFSGESVVTETIAELYTRQGFYDRAIAVYEELIRRRGDDERLLERLAAVQRLSRGEPEYPETESKESVDAGMAGGVGISKFAEVADDEEDAPFAEELIDEGADALSGADARWTGLSETVTGLEKESEAELEPEIEAALEQELESGFEPTSLGEVVGDALSLEDLDEDDPDAAQPASELGPSSAPETGGDTEAPDELAAVDPFAASFAEGFPGLVTFPGSGEAPDIGADVYASGEGVPGHGLAVGESLGTDQPGTDPGAEPSGADLWDAEPDGDLAAAAAAGEAFATDENSGSGESIRDFFAGLLAWEPGTSEDPHSREDLPAVDDGWEVGAGEEELESVGPAEPVRTAESAAAPAQEALPSDPTPPADVSDDDLFPWELPWEGGDEAGAADEDPEPAASIPTAYPPPPMPAADDQVEEHPQTPEPPVIPPPAASIIPPAEEDTGSDQPEDDDDLESFQAWLKSLKR